MPTIDPSLFRLPQIEELKRLTEAASAGVARPHRVREDLSGLSAAMGAVRAPWLRTSAPRVRPRFRRTAGDGRAAKREPAVRRAVSKALRLDLGDWRDEIAMPLVLLRATPPRGRNSSRARLNRALTGLTPRAFDESLAAAGLTDRSRAGSREEDAEEAGLARSRAAFDRLQRFERESAASWTASCGRLSADLSIKQRIPADMKDKWIEKRNIATSKGEAESPLIDYADFTDYKAIIERNDNWQAVFRHVFGRRRTFASPFNGSSRCGFARCTHARLPWTTNYTSSRKRPACYARSVRRLDAIGVVAARGTCS